MSEPVFMQGLLWLEGVAQKPKTIKDGYKKSSMKISADELIEHTNPALASLNSIL